MKTQFYPDGLPMPGQGRCRHCNHHGMIHGVNKCHHVNELADAAWPKAPPLEAYCKCKGFEVKP